MQKRKKIGKIAKSIRMLSVLSALLVVSVSCRSALDEYPGALTEDDDIVLDGPSGKDWDDSYSKDTEAGKPDHPDYPYGKDTDSPVYPDIESECDAYADYLTNECLMDAFWVQGYLNSCLSLAKDLNPAGISSTVDCMISQPCYVWKDENYSEDAVASCLVDSYSELEPGPAQEELIDEVCQYYVACEPTIPSMDYCLMGVELAEVDVLFNMVPDELAWDAVDCMPGEADCSASEQSGMESCTGIQQLELLTGDIVLP